MSDLLTALDYLTHADLILAPIIRQVGPCTIVAHTNYYQALVQSILGQQLSSKAADAIELRFIALCGEPFPSPEQILSKDIETLRSVGLSRPKAGYIQDLSRHVLDGSVHFDHIETLSNNEIITELTAVKGIGEWTVQMFLIFCMGRLDVLPIGDLGIKNGVWKLYELKGRPTAENITEIAAKYHWAPYESVASWYVWQSLKL